MLKSAIIMDTTNVPQALLPPLLVTIVSCPYFISWVRASCRSSVGPPHADIWMCSICHKRVLVSEVVCSDRTFLSISVCIF